MRCTHYRARAVRLAFSASRTRLGGACTTVCDGTRNFDPAHPWGDAANGAANGAPAAKKARK